MREIDTLKEHKKYQANYYPVRDECFKIMDEYGTPEHVKLHCHAVSIVGEAIAKALNAKGLKLNVPLVISAGCLHDIARVHSKHERVGAEYLVSLGLSEVADTIRNHTFHKITNKGFDITEEDVLCIADRLVVENKFVGAKKRMAYIAKKAVKKFGEEKQQEIEQWSKVFIQYIADLEIFIGKDLVSILPNSIQ